MTNHEFMQPIERKLEACRLTRNLAARAFYTSFGGLLQKGNPISEVDIRDNWLMEMRRSSDIFHDGWYTPPPNGIGVLIGTVDENSRHNYSSLRPEEMWPKPNIVLNNEHSLLYVYASPVDKSTGMIGDFGMTIYRGDDLVIKNHLQKCLQINYEILDKIEVGVTFSEVYQFATEIFKRYGLSNMVTSITDPASVNIGHTVPASYENWTEEEISLLRVGKTDWNTVAKTIKNKRKFASPIEQTRYKPGMAITLEPRLVIAGNTHVPMASFHTIVVIRPDGSKELLTNFDDIFKLAGMDYML